MTINREEFKELVALYTEAWENFQEYSDFIQENLLDELLFPTLNWVTEKIGLNIPGEDFDVVMDLAIEGKAAIGFDKEKDDFIYTDDLDEIYDMYLKEDK